MTALHVGGSFTLFSGHSIARLAAVNQSTGAVDTSFAAAPSGTVWALALSEEGSKLYAGGPFTTIGEASRPGAAELSATSGAATLSHRRTAASSFRWTSPRVVVCSSELPRNRTYAYDPSASGAPVYRVRTSGDLQAILFADEEVYIGGRSLTCLEAKLEQVHVASFQTASGRPTGWNPGANGSYGVWAIGLTKTALSPNAVPALSNRWRLHPRRRRRPTGLRPASFSKLHSPPSPEEF